MVRICSLFREYSVIRATLCYGAHFRVHEAKRTTDPTEVKSTGAAQEGPIMNNLLAAIVREELAKH